MSAFKPVSGNHRSEQRQSVRIAAQLRESGAGRFLVHVLDLSAGGFRIESLTYIPPHRLVFLTLPGLVPLEANIAWQSGDIYGCAFTRPLHVAVLDDIVRRFPALG